MRIGLITAFVLLALGTSSEAATFQQGGLRISEPWSRSAAAHTTGAGYLTLTNTGKVAETLTVIKTPAAARVEMHKTSMAAGMMSMKRLDKGLILRPGESVSFAPGGYHLMLVDLNKALKAGDAFPATLVFLSGTKIQVVFPVKATGSVGADHMSHH